MILYYHYYSVIYLFYLMIQDICNKNSNIMICNAVWEQKFYFRPCW